MKNEKMLNAIGKIDEDLVLAAMEVPAKKIRVKRNVWLKWGAVAACLCLFLATPVAAAAKVMLVDILADRAGWLVKTKERITVEDFSKEVQEFVEKSEEKSKYFVMESLEEAEEFLGVAIPDNALLEKAVKDKIHREININGQNEQYDAHCMVYLLKNKEGKLAVVDTDATYRYENILVMVNYRMNTDANSYDSGFGVEYSEMSEKDQTPKAIEHITPSGRECTIFYEGEAGGIFGGYGYVVVDGVLVQLYLMDISEAKVRNCMLELLDAFE